MRHKLCRSFHLWCPGIKTRCLYTLLYTLLHQVVTCAWCQNSLINRQNNSNEIWWLIHVRTVTITSTDTWRFVVNRVDHIIFISMHCYQFVYSPVTAASATMWPVPWPTTTCIVKWPCQSLRSITWCNNEVMSYCLQFKSPNHSLEAGYCSNSAKMMSCCNCDSDCSVGFCCHNAFRQMRTVHPIPQPTALGLGLPAHWCPATLGQQSPPEWEQYILYLSLQPWDWDFLLTGALLH